MKLLFFSSEREEVELVRKELVEAGTPCEVRDRAIAPGGNPSDAELWIHDKDSHRALMLCVELGVGFFKRAVTLAIDDG